MTIAPLPRPAAEDEIWDGIEQDPRGQVFAIDSEPRAEWLLSKLANIRAEIERIKKNSAERIEDLERDDARLRAMFGAQLEEWARANLPKNKKRIKLNNGGVSFRALAPTVKVFDPDAATAWANEYDPTLVSVLTITKLDTLGYKKLALRQLEQVGELLPGIKPVPARETMTIEI